MIAAFAFAKRYWPYIAGALAAVALVLWFNHKIDAAYDRGKTEQAAADTEAFRAAQDAATERQAALIAKTEAKGAAINKETTDALEKRNAVLARNYADLRRLWAAHKAHSGSAGDGDTTAVPGSAAAALAASCRAEGWVDFDTAAAASEAADLNAAQVNAWIDWYLAQKAAWPK
jgi:hypothetical protein